MSASLSVTDDVGYSVLYAGSSSSKQCNEVFDALHYTIRNTALLLLTSAVKISISPSRDNKPKMTFSVKTAFLFNHRFSWENECPLSNLDDEVSPLHSRFSGA